MTTTNVGHMQLGPQAFGCTIVSVHGDNSHDEDTSGTRNIIGTAIQAQTSQLVHCWGKVDLPPSLLLPDVKGASSYSYRYGYK